MTFRDVEEPRMIYTGPLPPHLARPETSDVAPFGTPPDDTGSRPWLAFAATAAVALAVGVAIGAFVTPALRSPPPAAPAAPTTFAAESRAPTIAPPPAAAEAPPVAELQPAAPLQPRAAVAVLTETPKTVVHASAKSDNTPACGAHGSRAERTVCADTQVAAADRDLKQAYQRALAAGAPAASLHSDQIDWLLAREDAARRSPADLALAYRQRIDQLNRLADEPPH